MSSHIDSFNIMYKHSQTSSSVLTLETMILSNENHCFDYKKRYEILSVPARCLAEMEYRGKCETRLKL